MQGAGGGPIVRNGQICAELVEADVIEVIG
jgi:hypothetical protein